MTRSRRWWMFNGVGALGIGVQLGALTALLHAGMAYQLATPLAVGAAVAHNYAWHRRWTWSDRTGGEPRSNSASRFVRFAAGNGMVSLCGSTILVPLLVEAAGLPIALASTLAIAACGIVNYWMADRFIFPVEPALV